MARYRFVVVAIEIEVAVDRRKIIVASGSASLGGILGLVGYEMDIHKKIFQKEIINPSNFGLRHGDEKFSFLNSIEIRHLIQGIRVGEGPSNILLSLSSPSSWRDADGGSHDLLWPDTHLTKIAGGISSLASPLVLIVQKRLALTMVKSGFVETDPRSGMTTDRMGEIVQAAATGRLWSSIMRRAEPYPVEIIGCHYVKEIGLLTSAFLAACVSSRGMWADGMTEVAGRVSRIIFGLQFPTALAAVSALAESGEDSMKVAVAPESAFVAWSLGRIGKTSRVNDLVAIYPNPTMACTHPMTANGLFGARAMILFRSSEILNLAWRKYGLRPNVADPAPGEHAVRGVISRPPIVGDMPSSEQVWSFARALFAAELVGGSRSESAGSPR